jgi:Flp pilus assembly pilin Flp
MKRFVMTQFRGQSLVEYSLSIALIGVVSITALMALGRSVKGSLSTLVPNATVEKASQSGDGQQDSSSAASSAPKGLPSSSPKDSVDPSLYSSMSNYGQLVVAMGANGTTDLLADKLMTYAQNLLAEGKLSEEQVNAFKGLANQGHRIADMEKLLEAAVDSGEATITFEGKTYPTFEFSQNIGWRGGAGIQGNLLDPPLMAQESPEMSVFRQEYQKLVASGALTHPEIKALTDNLTLGIGNISESLENTVADISKGTNKTTMIATLMAPQLTNTKSALICNTGGGQDLLNNCP